MLRFDVRSGMSRAEQTVTGDGEAKRSGAIGRDGGHAYSFTKRTPFRPFSQSRRRGLCVCVRGRVCVPELGGAESEEVSHSLTHSLSPTGGWAWSGVQMVAG